MAGIVWLASYPKSGNTWTRALLANYIRDLDEPVRINNLGGGPIASARQAFDDNVGVEASDLLPEEIERYRPGVYEQIAAELAESEHPSFLKVHDAYTYNAAGVPLMSKAATQATLYIVRNPLDVAVSFAHHSGVKPKKSVKWMNQEDFSFVGRDDRVFNQLKQRLLTWSGHVASWVDETGLNTMILRYEDLKADTVETFGRVVRHSGLEFDEARVEKAVEFASIGRLQEQETEHGFGEKPFGMKAFFRRGKVGGWRDELGEELSQRIIDDHGTMMRRLGYLDTDGTVLDTQPDPVEIKEQTG
ncbi:MAG: sulfotransferase domain-containing protein [Acidobacteria bacterium]|nr:sulfotransferase domain-containing protein [Acidobacteriota bacterium]